MLLFGFISDFVYVVFRLIDLVIRESWNNWPVTLIVVSSVFLAVFTARELNTRPPAEPIHIECFSPTGETFTTDIGIEFKKTDYMEYHIVEYNGRETTFEGSCDARKEK